MAGRMRRGMATVLVAAITSVMWGILPAAADVGTTTTYEADPNAGEVRVSIETTGDSISLPAGAADVVAILDGEPVDPVVRTTDQTLGLGFPTVGEIAVTFALDDGTDGPTGPVQANPAYLWFPTWVWGTPGDASVAIRVPGDFQIKVDGAILETAQEDGWTVMTAPVVTDPAAWDVTVSARRDGALTTEIIRAGDLTYVLRSWPGDTTWAGRVRGVLDLALPELAALTGIADPIGRPLVVAQSTDPQRNGFDGWYVAETDTVEVGSDPDVHVLIHEASHAWFNDQLVAERWLAEGLAETYTAMVEPVLGREAGDPPAPPSGFPPLAEWGNTAIVDTSTVEAERAAYAASWWVVDRLVDDVGTDAMAAVLADLADQRSAYAGPGFTITDTPADWRRLLDLLEARGADEAEATIAEWVAPPDSTAALSERAAVRTRYAALADDPLGWLPPVGVRTAMDRWDFATAESRIDASFLALAARDRLIADGVDVSGLRSAYEGATTPTIPESVVSAADPTLEPVETGPGAWPLWALTGIGVVALGGWAVSRREPDPVAVSSTPIDPRRVSEVGAQLELFDLPSARDLGPFTIIDLDVLARLDEELGDIDQPALFDLPPAPTPLHVEPDPWAGIVRTAGTARF